MSQWEGPQGKCGCSKIGQMLGHMQQWEVEASRKGHKR